MHRIRLFGSNPQDTQLVRTNYTRRGTVKKVDGSYGTLVESITRRADGLVTNLVYGDSAASQTATSYDDRRRPIPPHRTALGGQSQCYRRGTHGSIGRRRRRVWR